ncbi:MAG: hypothetical protein PHD05_10705 [Sphaerochaetaceae bacterium]|nr:hypothetical protein [Sphaerochaetaceae bacterium]
MGILNDLFSGVKNNLKWQAQSTITDGVSSGISAIVSKFKNKCPECHKSIKDTTANFCPNCQASLVLVCKKQGCGRQSPHGTKFCPGCGTKFESVKKEETEDEKVK